MPDDNGIESVGIRLKISRAGDDPAQSFVAAALDFRVNSFHDDAAIDILAEALVEVWERLRLPLKDRALAAE